MLFFYAKVTLLPTVPEYALVCSQYAHSTLFIVTTYADRL